MQTILDLPHSDLSLSLTPAAAAVLASLSEKKSYTSSRESEVTLAGASRLPWDEIEVIVIDEVEVTQEVDFYSVIFSTRPAPGAGYGDDVARSECNSDLTLDEAFTLLIDGGWLQASDVLFYEMEG